MKDGMFKRIYGLYDDEGTLVFTGTSRECAEYVGCKMPTFYTAEFRNYRVHRKYYVVFLREEEVLKRTCRICGKTRSIQRFCHIRRKDGSKSPTTLCKFCNNELVQKRKKEKEGV